MISRAIILAAGRGSRMQEATKSKPKCLNNLAEKTLLDWQLDALAAAGITDITLVRGYLSEMLQGNYNVVDNTKWQVTNMVASLFCVPPSLNSTIISYSDIVYNAEHIKKLNASEHDITITADKYWEELWRLRFENPLEDAETFKSKNGKLLEIGGKTNNITDIEAQYMGLIKTSPKGWKEMFDLYQTYPIEKRNRMDMTSMLNALLKKNISINVIIVKGKWVEADNYSDILAYENEIQTNRFWKHDWR